MLGVSKIKPIKIRPLTRPSLSMRSFISRPQTSLSSYFPAGTFYFYGYPYGETSTFLLKVPPELEELVAARVFACAGNQVNVVAYAGTEPPALPADLVKQLGLPHLKAERKVILPKTIDHKITGKARDRAIMQALLEKVPKGSLVMAQPYTDPKAAGLYQIKPEITTWINDKKNMGEYISEAFLSKRLAVYENGTEFAKHYRQLKLPYAVKVSSSSSGDGVYLCLDDDNVKTAVEQIKSIGSTILVEQYIEARKNYGIHFGIPHDPKKPIDILGVNEQLTSKKGEFIGSIINSKKLPEELYHVRDYLISEVLPRIRGLGWYGIGCFDVLADHSGGYHFIDCNFRMTGVSAYHFMLANGKLKEPVMSFGGEFHGSQADFANMMLPLAGEKAKPRFINLISLSHHGDIWRFNGALSFRNNQDLKEKAAQLLNAGVKSAALEQISTI